MYLEKATRGGLTDSVQPAPILLHPLVTFSIVWLGVVFLYSLHLSKLLLYQTQEVLRTVAAIWIPFALTVLICTFFYRILIYRFPAIRNSSPTDFIVFDRRLVVWFRIWVVISLVEIVVSGGVPLLWLVQGSSKTYMDFGVSSLHGLVNSLLLSLGICRFVLFLLTGQKRHLYIPAFILFWSILVVTRNMLLVAIIEFSVLAIRIKPIKKTTIAKFIAGTIVLILAFGAIGDYRSGSSDLIKLWAQPTSDYPDWLPSGVLWVYIYISTPINNLVYTSQIFRPLDDPTFPNTVSTLFPSVIRNLFYGKQFDEAQSGELVANAFNVSTAYIGPFQDFGYMGIVIFSIVIAMICQIVWFRSNLKYILIFAVLSQCLVLSLFFNHFFYLPVISQIFWISYFFSGPPRSRNKGPSLIQIQPQLGR